MGPALTDRMHRVIDPDAQTHSDGRGGFPVLILHGLFQSSGSFVTSEDRSLAFWLAREGKYQVYLGNTRGVFDMGHRTFSRNDPRFWGKSKQFVIKADLYKTGRLENLQCTTSLRSLNTSVEKLGTTRLHSSAILKATVSRSSLSPSECAPPSAQSFLYSSRSPPPCMRGLSLPGSHSQR